LDHLLDGNAVGMVHRGSPLQVIVPEPPSRRQLRLSIGTSTGLRGVVRVASGNASPARRFSHLAISSHWWHAGVEQADIDTKHEDFAARLAEAVRARPEFDRRYLHEVVPGPRRIAIVLNESHPSYAAFRAAAQSACATLGLAPVWVVASAPAQLPGAVEQIVRQRSQAVMVVGDAMYLGERVKLQALMQTTGLPVAYGLREHVVVGGLLSYASDNAANFRYAAKFVDKILKGAKPADLPVEQPTRFELVLNLKTAKELGLKIPQSVLLRVDEVIR
jgi:hypothetical protein